MKKKLLLSFILLDFVLVTLAVIIATQPDSYRVERALLVKAPVDVVFPYLNDYRKWNEWSPWSKIDPNIKTTYAGPSQGEGAIYRWAGNDDVGTGEMIIVESVSNEKVVHRLKFITPFESQAKMALVLVKEAQGTKVTWSMEGENDFMGKAFGLLMNMEEMIGKDYEKGLANLKPLVEKAASETIQGRTEKAVQEVGDAVKEGLENLKKQLGGAEKGTPQEVVDSETDKEK